MVLETSLLVDLLLSLSIGAIMGIEREIMHQKQEVRDFGGIRTFILIALLGFIIAYLATEILHSTAAFLLGFTAFMLLVIASYILIALKTGRIGMTTEIAATIAFLLSSLLVWDTEQKFNLIAVTLAVIVGALFAVILAIARILHLMFGKAGIYTASLIAGFADVDAITISLATLAGKASLENTTAILGITLAITANMIVKTAIAYMTGARSLAKIVAISFAAMIAAGALTTLFL